MRRLGAHLEKRPLEVFYVARRAACADMFLAEAEVALTNVFIKAFLQDVARVRHPNRMQKKRETVFSFDRELSDDAQVTYGDRLPDSRNCFDTNSHEGGVHKFRHAFFGRFLTPSCLVTLCRKTHTPK